MMPDFFNILLHVDVFIANIASQYGLLTYALVFLIVFCETGLVILPFLPGDSLLFALGSLCAYPNHPLNITVMFFLLLTASITGNQLNYFCGRFFNKPITTSRFINKKHLNNAQNFYKNHGGKTLIIARFMPIIRTFAPFIAGICKMPNYQFIFYNVASAMLWVGSLLGLGYGLGSLPWVKENFTIMIYALIGFSLLPSIFALLKSSPTTQTLANDAKKSDSLV